MSPFIDAKTFLRAAKVPGTNVNPKLICKYAKQSLCNYGLAGRSAVFRYLPSLPIPLYNMNDLFHLCSAIFNNTSLRIYFDVALPAYNKIYVHPEIIVIEPLAYTDYIVSITEVMMDPRVMYTILTYKFHIIISLITFFIINCCLKKQFYILTGIILIYCFKLFAYFSIVLIVFRVFHFVHDSFFPVIFHDRELLKESVIWYFSFPVSVIINHYLPEIVQVISALALLLLKWCLKVSKPT